MRPSAMLPSGPSTWAVIGRSSVPNDEPKTVALRVPDCVVCTTTPLGAVNFMPVEIVTGVSRRLVKCMVPWALPRGTWRVPVAGLVPSSKMEAFTRVAVRSVPSVGDTGLRGSDRL